MTVNYSVLLYSESVIALVGASNKEKTTDNFSKYSIPNIIKHRWHVCPGHLMSCAAPGSAPRPECRVAAPAPSGGLCHLLISATWGALGHSVSPLASSIPASHMHSLFIWSQVVHLHILEHNYVTHVPPLYIIKTHTLSLSLSSLILSTFPLLLMVSTHSSVSSDTIWFTPQQCLPSLLLHLWHFCDHNIRTQKHLIKMSHLDTNIRSFTNIFRRYCCLMLCVVSGPHVDTWAMRVSKLLCDCAVLKSTKLLILVPKRGHQPMCDVTTVMRRSRWKSADGLNLTDFFTYWWKQKM